MYSENDGIIKATRRVQSVIESGRADYFRLFYSALILFLLGVITLGVSNDFVSVIINIVRFVLAIAVMLFSARWCYGLSVKFGGGVAAILVAVIWVLGYWMARYFAKINFEPLDVTALWWAFINIGSLLGLLTKLQSNLDGGERIEI